MGEADARVLNAEQIRDAATVVLLRQTAEGPRVLMGQRGAAAATADRIYRLHHGALHPA